MLNLNLISSLAQVAFAIIAIASYLIGSFFIFFLLLTVLFIAAILNIVSYFKIRNIKKDGKNILGKYGSDIFFVVSLINLSILIALGLMNKEDVPLVGIMFLGVVFLGGIISGFIYLDMYIHWNIVIARHPRNNLSKIYSMDENKKKE